MSYCRQPYYIYPKINGAIVFDIFGDIPDEVVNIFLYKLYNFRNDEFIERTELGRKALDEWNDSIKDDIEQPSKKLQTFEDMYEEPTERCCTVAESLEQSLKEMQLMRQGKKTWIQHMEELDNE